MSGIGSPLDVVALRKRYAAAGQEHLFQFWDDLDPASQGLLATQLQELDVERVNAVYARAIEGEKEAAQLAGKRSQLEAPPHESTVSVKAGSDEETRLASVGLEAIASGKVGVLLMAGGQGTRLGSSAPKGCYDIGLPSHKSLFQLQAERIARLQTLAAQRAGKKHDGVVITWFIMTSGPTRKPTEDYFHKNNYFGLAQDNVIFFEQGTLPCLTMEGKVMLDSQSNIATAPDGNGGLYTALRRPITQGKQDTVVSLLQSRGIEYLHAYGVDNCLVKVGDPVFLGCCIEKQVQAGVKTVRKTEPKESVGVIAKKDGNWGVIEYSEIPKELSEARDADGQLTFRAANIVNHFYTTSFLAKDVPSFEAEMAFHIARKKIPCVDLASGQLTKPSTPNGMKLELFVFDVFPFVKDLIVHEVERNVEFSPLKNAPGTGTDDPQTSKRDLLALQRRWLEAAGATFAKGSDGDVEVEVSPLVSYGGEELENFKGRTFDKTQVIA